MMGTFRGDKGRWSAEGGRYIFAAWVVMDRIDSVWGNKKQSMLSVLPH